VAVRRGLLNHHFFSNDPPLENVRGNERFIALIAEAEERQRRLET
jgi:hypothetical protein